MNSIEIYRPGINDALENIPTLIQEFAKEIGFPEKPDNETIRQNTLKLWDNQITILARDKQTNQLFGGMQAMVVPHIWNANVLASQEMFFYIMPQKRKGTLALRLLKRHNLLMGICGVKLSSLSMMSTSPKSLERVYQKMGYSKLEATWLKHFPSSLKAK